ncbi:hypothetical protein [Natrinema salaciae]|uniref:Envelope protein N-terminal domain-containing protein n=1 Tax=Natrinema salaciae TaxID=1186196 RepID=A0A1H9S0C6_9EURY|nr:hypothetical protein [Natrinema salaciae]SER78394.1 hypothetical protein SAMN04489841_4529 [Natrinema salaciae]
MTQSPQPTELDAAGSSMTRRGLFKRAAIAGGTMVAAPVAVDRIVPRYSPIGRAAAFPHLLVGVAALAAASYIAGRYHGSDIEGVQDPLAFEDHLRIYNEAQEIYEVSDPELLASLKRDARNLQDAVRETAIMTMYESVATGASRSEARVAAEDAIGERFAVPQESIATRVNSISEGIIQSAIDLGVLYTRNPYTGQTHSNPENHGDLQEQQEELHDGRTVPVMYKDQTGGTTDNEIEWNVFNTPGTSNYEGSSYDFVVVGIEEPDPADYDGVNADDYDLDHVDGRQPIANADEYADVLAEIGDGYNGVMNEIDALLDTHYDGISAGDLSVAEMLSTDAMLDVVAEAESWQEAALYFRALGLSEAVEPGRVSFDVSEVETPDGGGNETDGNTTDNNSTDNATDLPDDGVVTVDGKLAWSISDEVQGNELPVGSQIFPDSYPGDFYMALEYEDSDGNMVGEVVHLTTPFTIEGTNGGGNVLPFEARDVVTSDTDPSDAQEIFRENRESEKQAREQTIEVVIEESGNNGPGPLLPDGFGLEGGGQWLGLSIIGVVVLAVVGIVTDAIPGMGN